MMLLKAGKDHFLYEKDEDTGEVSGPVCEAFTVLRRISNPLTGDITLWIGLWVRGVLKRFPLDRRLLVSDKFLAEFVAQGLSSCSFDADVEEALRTYLLRSELKVKEECAYDKLGFHEVFINKTDKQLVFLADKVYGCPGVDFRYHLPEVIKKGTLDSWRQFVSQEVIGHLYLELALAISISAPIVHIFRMKGIFAENPIWVLVGRSSSGKTTALRVMASVYGSPAEGRGLIGDLNATENAFYAMLADTTGLPHLIDEATCHPNWNFTSVIYNLSKGEDKARCKGNGNLRDRLYFSGPIVFSSERSLFEQSSPDLGIYSRMIELNVSWTDSANHARNILRKASENYGTAIGPIAKLLMNILNKGSNILVKMFDTELTSLRAALGYVPGEQERLLNTYSTVLVAAQIANTTLKIGLDIDGLRRLFLQIHQGAPKASNLALDLHDAIKEQAHKYGNNFLQGPLQGGNTNVPFNIWGEYSKHNGRNVLWITQATFQKFATEGGFDNYKSLLPDLYSQKLIEKFGDRYLTSHSFANGHGTVKCYCLILL